MRSFHPQLSQAIAASVALLCLCAATLAHAQARYTCRSSEGSAYISDRPCPSGAPGMLSYGPVQGVQSNPSYISRTPNAPDHLKYLSPHCSSLNDGIRTSAARGIRGEVVAEQQRNYQRECSEDEQKARNQLSAERADSAAAKKAAQNMVAMKQSLTEIERQQCDESRRIIYVKKKRTDLTEGERADLHRFEDNAKARCGW